MGLLAAGEVGSDAVTRGIEYLLREQRSDGSWSEEHWTGTGFPSVFYLRYHLYPVYFPLLALGIYEQDCTNTTRATGRVHDLHIASSTPKVAAP